MNVDQGPALISYTIDAEDLKGPFVDVPEDMMAKAKLPYLGYASPRDELGEKFHVNPKLLQALNPRATFQSAGLSGSWSPTWILRLKRRQPELWYRNPTQR